MDAAQTTAASSGVVRLCLPAELTATQTRLVIDPASSVASGSVTGLIAGDTTLWACPTADCVDPSTDRGCDSRIVRVQEPPVADGGT